MALWLFEKLSVGYGKSYDDTSHYPSIQQSAVNFSIGKGKFQILKDFTNHREYSHFEIFRVSIEKKDTPLFRYNYHNVYTHIDFTHAKALGLQVTLIQDGASNALIYEKETQIRDGEVLDSIVPIGEEQWRFQFTNPGNPFKGEYPRIAPFLLAYSQKFISKMVQLYIDKVRHIHTNGFILEEDVNNSPLYTCSKDAFKTLKALKFEREEECHVKNANQVV
ncbi:hypothetical protein RclHR1_35020002 [Rhizophagus clarus]|uniref:Uncharacterized protein n=1 Tax=Rhizophagus clarus TaxID=94130 RepID=A0A2Z6RSB1_9GLOM|nr:hypothetical protein RclHR1_35020002 [Rhizophagus clarus]